MVSPETRVEYVLSENLRYGNKRQKAALLKWLRQKKFRNRKPAPQELIEVCKQKGHPLYGLMEVGKTEAAEKYWHQTAQDIIRHVDRIVICIATQKIVSKPLKAFVHVAMGPGGRIPEDNYQLMNRVVEVSEYSQTVLDRAYQDLWAWLNRYEKYAEVLSEEPLASLITRIRNTLKKCKQEG